MFNLETLMPCHSRLWLKGNHDMSLPFLFPFCFSLPFPLVVPLPLCGFLLALPLYVSKFLVEFCLFLVFPLPSSCQCPSFGTQPRDVRTARSVDVLLHVPVKNDVRHLLNVFRKFSWNKPSHSVCHGDVLHLAASVLDVFLPLRLPTFPCGQGLLSTTILLLGFLCL